MEYLYLLLFCLCSLELLHRVFLGCFQRQHQHRQIPQPHHQLPPHPHRLTHHAVSEEALNPTSQTQQVAYTPLLEKPTIASEAQEHLCEKQLPESKSKLKSRKPWLLRCKALQGPYSWVPLSQDIMEYCMPSYQHTPSLSVSTQGSSTQSLLGVSARQYTLAGVILLLCTFPSPSQPLTTSEFYEQCRISPDSERCKVSTKIVPLRINQTYYAGNYKFRVKMVGTEATYKAMHYCSASKVEDLFETLSGYECRPYNSGSPENATWVGWEKKANFTKGTYVKCVFANNGRDQHPWCFYSNVMHCVSHTPKPEGRIITTFEREDYHIDLILDSVSPDWEVKLVTQQSPWAKIILGDPDLIPNTENAAETFMYGCLVSWDKGHWKVNPDKMTTEYDSTANAWRTNAHTFVLPPGQIPLMKGERHQDSQGLYIYKYARTISEGELHITGHYNADVYVEQEVDERCHIEFCGTPSGEAEAYITNAYKGFTIMTRLSLSAGSGSKTCKLHDGKNVHYVPPGKVIMMTISNDKINTQDNTVICPNEAASSKYVGWEKKVAIPVSNDSSWFKFGTLNFGLDEKYLIVILAAAILYVLGPSPFTILIIGALFLAYYIPTAHALPPSMLAVGHDWQLTYEITFITLDTFAAIYDIPLTPGITLIPSVFFALILWWHLGEYDRAVYTCTTSFFLLRHPDHILFRTLGYVMLRTLIRTDVLFNNYIGFRGFTRDFQDQLAIKTSSTMPRIKLHSEESKQANIIITNLRALRGEIESEIPKLSKLQVSKEERLRAQDLLMKLRAFQSQASKAQEIPSINIGKENYVTPQNKPLPKVYGKPRLLSTAKEILERNVFYPEEMLEFRKEIPAITTVEALHLAHEVLGINSRSKWDFSSFGVVQNQALLLALARAHRPP